MARVVMLQSVSGGRGDGTPWPLIGEPLECGDDEARHLIGAKLARAADAEPVTDGAEQAQDGQTGAPAGDESPEPENGSQPLVRDPKQAWVDHATAQGAPAEDAAAMTKADLIATYGAPD